VILESEEFAVLEFDSN